VRIAYYRSVRDSDDGCGIYQCLHCGQTWEWRGGSAPVRFCLFCGQAIERLETRDQDTPRWKHDLEKRYGDDWPEKRGQMWQEEWEKRDRRQPPYWVIEERCFILRDGEYERLLNDWKHRSNLLGCGYKHPVSAHVAYQELLRRRHEEAVRDTPEDPDYDPDDHFMPAYRHEYRLRRETP